MALIMMVPMMMTAMDIPVLTAAERTSTEQKKPNVHMPMVDSSVSNKDCIVKERMEMTLASLALGASSVPICPFILHGADRVIFYANNHGICSSV